jgi:threonine/homoserine/homoserine lactone efflux protein
MARRHGASGRTQHQPHMSPQEWWALLVLATATSFTPGPNTTLSASLAANGGLRSAMRFVCAVPVGWGLLLLIGSLGFGALVLAVPPLRWAIVWAGTAYLLWLAWRLAHSHHLHTPSHETLQVGFVQGVGLQFLNIKAWMMALSIVGGWISGHPNALERFVQVLPVLMAYAFFSNLTYASVGSVLRHWLSGPIVQGQASGRRLRRFNQTMALALVLTAAWMLWQQTAFAYI